MNGIALKRAPAEKHDMQPNRSKPHMQVVIAFLRHLFLLFWIILYNNTNNGNPITKRFNGHHKQSSALATCGKSTFSPWQHGGKCQGLHVNCKPNKFPLVSDCCQNSSEEGRCKIK